MVFPLSLLPAFAAATVSIGEALGIGAGVIGIGAAVKGTADYHRAKTIQENAGAGYQKAVRRVERKAMEAQKKLEDFGPLKLRTYTGVISEAAELLSNFINVSLSSFKDIQVERIRLFINELSELKEPALKASDALSCLSTGVTTAVNGRFPYKDTPPLFQSIGAFGLKPLPVNGLPPIPYAAIVMAGITWGLSGNAAKRGLKQTPCTP
jgi:hypothetical protein